METTLPFIRGVPPSNLAIRDDSRDWLNYGELSELARGQAAKLAGTRGLVFLYAGNDVETVAALLGALSAGHTLALFDPALPAHVRAQLEKTYEPSWVIGPRPGEVWRRGCDRAPLHPDLSILLSTSGSTGSAKLVRLTLGALLSNAAGIAHVLDIQPDDVAAGYLPLHYSYGLSVLTSHLAKGARIRLTNAGLTDRSFWPAMRDAGVTHLPGVPFHYQILLKLGLKRLNLPDLKTMTQAGGALDVALRAQVHDFMHAIGGRFFVLYGQTEAAPRMTTLQHRDFREAPKSVGTALPNCRIEILDPDSDGHGEVVFFGPNVMMGYAENLRDLAEGDVMRGRLPTGDIGFLDAAGRLTLTGRAKRMGKVFGLRINLDEVETLANGVAPSAVTQTGEAVIIHIVSTGDQAKDERLVDAMRSRLLDQFTVPQAAYHFRFVSDLPRTERGKVNYVALETRP
jgi:acyl-CoA synthetase (AMP-forming)/AMP-acid ligase II